MYRVGYMYDILFLKHAQAKKVVFLVFMQVYKVLCHPEWCHIYYIINEDFDLMILLLLLTKHCRSRRIYYRYVPHSYLMQVSW